MNLFLGRKHACGYRKQCHLAEVSAIDDERNSFGQLKLYCDVGGLLPYPSSIPACPNYNIVLTIEQRVILGGNS